MSDRNEHIEKCQEEKPQQKWQLLSNVWDHYKLNQEENKVHCVYCKTELVFYNAAIS